MPIVKINKNYKRLYTSEDDLIIITGGRASGKSFVVADWACRNTYHKNETILYTRYTLTAAKDSIIPEYKDKIDLFNAENHFNITESCITNLITESKILFKGIKNSSGNQTANLKSIKDPTKWICDEAIEIPDYDTFQKIRRSLRKKGSKIQTILLLNPENLEHWICQKFFIKNNIPDDFNGSVNGITYIHTTYLDNLDNLDEVFLNDARDTKLEDINEYNNIFLGYWGSYLLKKLFPNEKLQKFTLDQINIKDSIVAASYTDTANGGDYFCTVYVEVINNKAFVLDVMYNKDVIILNQEQLPSFIIRNKIKYNVIESNAQGYLFGKNIQNAIGENYQVALHNNSQNKETRIKVRAFDILNFFIFRTDIDENIEYKQFMFDLCSYVYNAKNKTLFKKKGI